MGMGLNWNGLRCPPTPTNRVPNQSLSRFCSLCRVPDPMHCVCECSEHRTGQAARDLSARERRAVAARADQRSRPRRDGGVEDPARHGTRAISQPSLEPHPHPLARCSRRSRPNRKAASASASSAVRSVNTRFRARRTSTCASADCTHLMRLTPQTLAHSHIDAYHVCSNCQNEGRTKQVLIGGLPTRLCFTCAATVRLPTPPHLPPCPRVTVLCVCRTRTSLAPTSAPSLLRSLLSVQRPLRRLLRPRQRRGKLPPTRPHPRPRPRRRPCRARRQPRRPSPVLRDRPRRVPLCDRPRRAPLPACRPLLRRARRVSPSVNPLTALCLRRST
jgi:hypothetical protein